MSKLIDADQLIKEIRKWYWDKEKQEAAKKDVSPMDLFTNLAITTVKISRRHLKQRRSLSSLKH